MKRKKKKKIHPEGVALIVVVCAIFVFLLGLFFMNISSLFSFGSDSPGATEESKTIPIPPSSHGTGQSAGSTVPVASSTAGSPPPPPPQKDAYEASAGYLAVSRDRYERYAVLYPELDEATVVKYVNMGLDREFYQEPQPVADPASLTALVNKYHYLPSTYVPSDLVKLKYVDPGRKDKSNHPQLRAEAAAAFDLLCEEAAKEGMSILGFSGYRSYQYQQNIYNSYCENDSQEVVDTYSARAGYSEHQTGLAIDVCTRSTAYNRFGQTKEYQWALKNIHRFGFIVSYPVTEIVPGTQAEAGDEPTYLHGYKLEEWHFRYVGVELATELYESGLLLDEYYAVHGEKA